MYWVQSFKKGDVASGVTRAIKPGNEDNDSQAKGYVIYHATTRAREQRRKFESPASLRRKAYELCNWIDESRSTEIAPERLLSLSRKLNGENVKNEESPKVVVLLGREGRPGDFPSTQHLALNALVAANKVDFIVSTSTDGQQRAVGTSTDNLLELMGNDQEEICTKCGSVWYRDYRVGRMEEEPLMRFGYHDMSKIPVSQRSLLSGNRCDKLSCRAPLLYNFIQDNDHVSKSKFIRALDIVSRAQLLIVLGTRLSTLPEAILPAAFCVNQHGTSSPRTLKQGKRRLVIVHDQSTSLDHKTDLKINSAIGELLTTLLHRFRIPRSMRFKLVRYFRVWSEFNPKAVKPHWTLFIQSFDGRMEPISALHVVEAYSESFGELIATEDSCASLMKMRMFCTSLRPGEVSYRIFFVGTYREPCLQLDHILSTSIQGKQCAKLWHVELKIDKATGKTSWSDPKWVKETRDQQVGDGQIEHHLAEWGKYAVAKKLPTPMMEQPAYFTEVDRKAKPHSQVETLTAIQKLQRDWVKASDFLKGDQGTDLEKVTMEICRRVERALFGVRFANEALYKWATGEYLDSSNLGEAAANSQTELSATGETDNNGTSNSPAPEPSTVQHARGIAVPVKHRLFPSSTSHHLFKREKQLLRHEELEAHRRKMERQAYTNSTKGHPEVIALGKKFEKDRSMRQQRLQELACNVTDGKVASLLHDKPQWWKPP